METAEKVIIAVCLAGGLLWLRSRARSMDLGSRQGPVTIGVFLILPALLFAAKWAYDRLPRGQILITLLEAAALVAVFAAVGYGFLRPGPPRAGSEVPPTPSRRD